MTTDLQKIINNVVAETFKELITEKLRNNFNFSHFKNLTSLSEMEKYAKKTLGKPTGEGSSRIVWILSSGKVLKIAKKDFKEGEPGQEQNKAEVDLWTNPKTKPIIAAVYDYEPNFKWIVSELVKPFNHKNISKYLNINFDVFEDLAEHVLSRNISFKVGLDGYIITKQSWARKYKNKLEIYLKDPTIPKEDIENAKNNIEEIEEILKEIDGANFDALEKIFNGLIELRKIKQMPLGDLILHDHYGLTADGRIVVLDYGFDYEIAKKYY